MNRRIPLKALPFIVLVFLLYNSIHFVAAQQIIDEPFLQAYPATNLVAAALPDPLFHAATTLSLGDQSYAHAVGIGDFNHDKRADVALTSGLYGVSSLYIFLQGADGNLQNPELYPADGRPEALAVGDLNGDGKDDIAVASVLNNRVSVYLQTADGKLADRKQYSTQQGPDALAIADINEDGLADVVVSHWNHASVGLLYQQPNGTLAEMVLYGAPQAGYDDIDTGDVNGDGLPDVVKMNGQGINPTLSVLHQTISNTLETATAYEVPNDIFSRGIAIGDITGDGKADAVVTHYGDATDPYRYKVSTLAQQTDGTLLLIQSLLASTTVEPVEIADVNGDGRNDVIVGGDARLLVYLQLGDGTLASFQEYQVPTATHSKPQALDVGDINNDGLPDVVMANYSAGLVVLVHALQPTSTPSPTSTPIPTVETPTPPPTAESLSVIYLPLVSRAEASAPTPTPADPVAFSATTLCESEAANWEYSPVRYPYGKRLLAATFTFVNQIGRNWRLEWTQDGQSRPALDQSGIVTKSPDPYVVEIFYGAGACQLPLPRGVYEVKIYLDNVLWQQGQATIE